MRAEEMVLLFGSRGITCRRVPTQGKHLNAELCLSYFKHYIMHGFLRAKLIRANGKEVSYKCPLLAHMRLYVYRNYYGDVARIPLRVKTIIGCLCK